MKLKWIGALSLLVFFLVPIRADLPGDDSSNTAASLSKTSSDHRIKITLLYVGPVHDAKMTGQFVVVYLEEDMRSAEEYEQHHFTPPQNGNGATGVEYAIMPVDPEVKDGSRRDVAERNAERGGSVSRFMDADFVALYPNVKMPTIDNPKRACTYEWFFKSPTTGPFDVVVHDRFPAYDENAIRFDGVDFPVSPSFSKPAVQ